MIQRAPRRPHTGVLVRRSASFERHEVVSADFESVSLVSISRSFGRRRALSAVSLSARSGEIVGLLGPNGAGKSTLIGVLATLVAPTAGEVRYGQSDARTLGPALRRHIGLLAHELHLYPELSARQNLAFFAELYGLDRDRTVESALENAGLVDRADDPVASFSRGMRQRLALERALLHEPRLLLFDEPFTGLDDRAVALLADRLRRLASGGCIVFVATHDLDLADGLVSRVALVRGGRLLSDEPANGGLRARYRQIVGSA
jgi:heme ABC exporter ATP-binding subunit CcmA